MFFLEEKTDEEDDWGNKRPYLRHEAGKKKKPRQNFDYSYDPNKKNSRFKVYWFEKNRLLSSLPGNFWPAEINEYETNDKPKHKRREQLVS